jgi:simple sugar transport system ATP-binding protein
MSFAPLLQMKNIYKRFDGVVALENVSLELNHDEILGLVGDNGAGKSTLIKIISGVFQPTEGEIFLKNKKVKIRTPKEAKKLGIETVYQDLALADNLDIARNIFVGKELIKPGCVSKLLKIVDKRKMWDESKKILHNLGIEIESTKILVRNLSGGQRQSVAVGKTLYANPEIIIMDEPTAAVSVKEREKILNLIENLKEKHISIIFISHNLQEIFSVVDRIIILNRGRIIGNKKADETTMDEVIKLMLG